GLCPHPRGFFFSSRRRHTRWPRDWSSDVCSSDLTCLSSSCWCVKRRPWTTSLFIEWKNDSMCALSVISLGRFMFCTNPERRGDRSEERRVGKECRSRLSTEC